jgi:Ca-activated chloride channel family protein
VNHFLLDNMARYGRGEVEYVALNDDGSAAAKRFHERVHNPVLPDISIDWGGLPVTDLYPARIPDMFSAKPVVVFGKYRNGASGAIRLRGKLGGRDFSREIRVNLPETEPRHDVLATLWARARVDDLMSQDFAGLQRGNPRADVKDQITQLGLDYRLMTQFTSFVAVEETTIVEGGQPRRVEVPVEMPDGVSYEGVFGESQQPMAMAKNAAMPSAHRSFTGIVVGGVLSGNVAAQAPPPAGEMLDRAEIYKPATPASKLDPALRAVLENRPVAGQAAFYKDGKVTVQVFLADVTPATLNQLKSLGFELMAQPKSGTIVLGRMPLAKVRELEALTVVRYIAAFRG